MAGGGEATERGVCSGGPLMGGPRARLAGRLGGASRRRPWVHVHAV